MSTIDYERLRTITDVVPDVVIVYDKSGRYQEVLTGQEQLLEDDPRILKGATIDEVLDSEAATILQEGIHRTLETGDIQTVEYLLELEGEPTWFEGRLAPLSSDNANQVVLLARDITERKKYEQELECARERIQRERDGKEAVHQLLLQSTTDVGITKSVCRLLVDSYDYECAWVTRSYTNSSSVDTSYRTVARHGEDNGLCDNSSETTAIDEATQLVLDSHEQTVTIYASGVDNSLYKCQRNGFTSSDNTGSITETGEFGAKSLANRLERCNLHSIHSVSLEHEGLTFGALSVVRSERGSKFSREIVGELAGAIAFKQQVQQQRDALTVDTVTQLKIRLVKNHFLSVLSTETEIPDKAVLDAYELQTSVDPASYLINIANVEPEKAVEATTKINKISEATIINDDGSSLLLKVHLPTLGSVLEKYSVTIKSIQSRGGRVDISVDIPPRTPVRKVVEAIRSHWPCAKMITRNERPVKRSPPLLFDSLTKKQEESLRVGTKVGFFDRPQGATAADVAEILDISRPTFLYHIRTAERKLFEAAFDEAKL